MFLFKGGMLQISDIELIKALGYKGHWSNLISTESEVVIEHRTVHDLQKAWTYVLITLYLNNGFKYTMASSSDL